MKGASIKIDRIKMAILILLLFKNCPYKFCCIILLLYKFFYI